MNNSEKSIVVNSRNGIVLGNNVRCATHWLRRLIGLLGTRSIEADTGLWLKPCRSIHTIGMWYPIDVIFMDKANKVLKTSYSLRPFQVCSVKKSACSVLEVPTGTLHRCNVKVGDMLEFTLLQ